MNRVKLTTLLSSLVWLAVVGIAAAQVSQEESVTADEAKVDGAQVDADLPPQPVMVAVLGVYAKGDEVKELAPKITSLLTASLSTRTDIQLVEREEIDKVLSELELNLSGMVDPKTANQIGRMTGARILVSAATFQVDGALYIVAKLIGVETTRVLAVTVKGSLDKQLDLLTDKLAEDASSLIVKRQADLILPEKSEEDRLELLKKKFVGAKLPVLSIDISEKHTGKTAAEPTAQVEMTRICRGLGFTVIDKANPRSTQADISITGQASSEFAMQRQNLTGVRARVEIMVKDRDGKVLVADRQTLSKVALTERIAGQVAIEEATLTLAERVLPQITRQ